MKPTKEVLHILIANYSKIGRAFRWITYVAIFSISLTVVAPLIESKTYRDLIQQIEASPTLSHIIDIDGWITDHIISCAAVLFAVLALTFAAYHVFKDKAEDLNHYLKYTSYLTRSIGSSLISLFMAFAGVGAYVMSVPHSEATGIMIINSAFLLFGMPGLVINHTSNIKINPNRALNISAPYAAIFFGALTVLSLIYNAIAPLIDLAALLIQSATLPPTTGG